MFYSSEFACWIVNLKDMDLEKPTDIESNTGSLFFSNVPRVRRKKGSTAEETTHCYMDRTPQLEEMIVKEYAGNELAVLGELQPLCRIWYTVEVCEGWWRLICKPMETSLSIQ